MRIDHIAIWTKNLEEIKAFYMKYFNAKANSKYTNKSTGFESYFLTFDSGCRLELMSQEQIPENKNDVVNRQHLGLIHFAIEADSVKEVDQKAKQLRTAGFKILRGPRITGDGYYEFETLDPEENRIEVTTKIDR